MKSIYRLISRLTFVGIMAAAVLATSCRDEDLNPMPDFISGGLVKANIPAENSFFDLTDLENAKFVMNLEATDKEGGALVESYEVYVEYVSVVGGIDTDTVLLTTITNFPSTYQITAAELADLFEVPGGLQGLNGGDVFNFDMKVKMKDGRVFEQANSSAAIVNEANSRGTFKYVLFIGCPFVPEDIEGTYAVVADSWEIAPLEHTTVEVVAGPGANQITIKDVFGFGYDMVVSVAPQSGAASATRQQTWSPGYWGFPADYGRGFAAAAAANGSTVFSCIGTVTLQLTISVDLGTFGGVHEFALEKM